MNCSTGCDISRLEPRQAEACRSLHRQPIALSNAFFSKTNIAYLQSSIKRQIVQRLGYMISDQSEDTLFQVMVKTYEWYSMLSDYNIQAQVLSLNKKVLGITLPNIATNIKQELYYKKMMSGDIPVLPLPEVTSQKGTQIVPTFRGF